MSKQSQSPLLSPLGDEWLGTGFLRLKLTVRNHSSPKGDKRGAFGITGGLLLSHHLLAANDDESTGILAHWLTHDVVCFLVILAGLDVIYSSSGGL